MRLGRWAAIAAALSMLAASACAGNAVSPTSPGAVPGVAAGDQRVAPQLGFSSGVIAPDLTCPKQYIVCYPFSISKGLVVDWCYNVSGGVCNGTSSYKWSGGVCLAGAKVCVAPKGPFIKTILAKWTGPFACKPTIGVCKGGSSGTYVIDTLRKGKTPPKVISKIAYKQDIHLVGASTFDGYMGLSVTK